MYTNPFQLQTTPAESDAVREAKMYNQFQLYQPENERNLTRYLVSVQSLYVSTSRVNTVYICLMIQCITPPLSDRNLPRPIIWIDKCPLDHVVGLQRPYSVSRCRSTRSISLCPKTRCLSAPAHRLLLVLLLEPYPCPLSSNSNKARVSSSIIRTP